MNERWGEGVDPDMVKAMSGKRDEYEGPDSAMARSVADEDARINARMPRDDSNEPEA